jgi:hypothetical protein
MYVSFHIIHYIYSYLVTIHPSKPSGYYMYHQV